MLFRIPSGVCFFFVEDFFPPNPPSTNRCMNSFGPFDEVWNSTSIFFCGCFFLFSAFLHPGFTVGLPPAAPFDPIPCAIQQGLFNASNQNAHPPSAGLSPTQNFIPKPCPLLAHAPWRLTSLGVLKSLSFVRFLIIGPIPVCSRQSRGAIHAVTFSNVQ